jgi:hypothetical protein
LRMHGDPVRLELPGADWVPNVGMRECHGSARAPGPPNRETERDYPGSVVAAMP